MIMMVKYLQLSANFCWNTLNKLSMDCHNMLQLFLVPLPVINTPSINVQLTYYSDYDIQTIESVNLCWNLLNKFSLGSHNTLCLKKSSHLYTLYNFVKS